jgi:hypothetical protein
MTQNAGEWKGHTVGRYLTLTDHSGFVTQEDFLEVAFSNNFVKHCRKIPRITTGSGRPSASGKVWGAKVVLSGRLPDRTGFLSFVNYMAVNCAAACMSRRRSDDFAGVTGHGNVTNRTTTRPEGRAGRLEPLGPEPQFSSDCGQEVGRDGGRKGPDPTITGERPGRAISIVLVRSPRNREPRPFFACCRRQPILLGY